MGQTAAHDGVKLWDLRKLKNFRSFEPYSDAPTNSGMQFFNFVQVYEFILMLDWATCGKFD